MDDGFYVPVDDPRPGYVDGNATHTSTSLSNNYVPRVNHLDIPNNFESISFNKLKQMEYAFDDMDEMNREFKEMKNKYEKMNSIVKMILYELECLPDYGSVFKEAKARFEEMQLNK